MKGFYFITDSKLSVAGNVSDVENAVAAGACAVQYRNKEGSTKEMYEEAMLLKKACKDANQNILFIINDRIDIALAVDADGVHLGQDDMPYEIARRLLGSEKTIGITVHDAEEALAAERIGADYLGVSPVFSTPTKGDAGKPCGVSLIRELKEICSIPLIAIGGITLENAVDVVNAGADGLCAISSVITKPDVKKEILEFQRMFE